MFNLPPFGLPPSWTNQHIMLYHGTVDTHLKAIKSSINVRSGSTTLDFGQGFYTTTQERQAKYWAWQVSQQSHHPPGTKPAIISFEVDREKLASLDTLWFVRGDYYANDFWSLIFHCRAGNDHQYSQNSGWYDVVIGPVTNPYIQRSVMPDYDQMSFHTVKSAAILNVSNRKHTVFDPVTGHTLTSWRPL